MAGKKNELGATGSTVAANVERLRSEQRLGYAELSRALAELGRHIPPLGLRRIESGERRVDVDDLVALAAALNTSPAALLAPNATSGDELVDTSADSSPVAAERLWLWTTGERQLDGDTSTGAWLQFLARSAPTWRREQLVEGLRDIAEINRLTAEAEAGGERGEAAQRRLSQMAEESMIRGRY